MLKKNYKKIGNKKENDVELMWLNWSIVTINATLHRLDIYR